MPNKLLRTLTIDGVPNDALGVGDYLQLDNDNKATPIISHTIGNLGTATLAHNTTVDRSILTIPTDGFYLLSISATFASNSTGARYIAPIANSTVLQSCITRVQAAANGTTTVGASICTYLSAGTALGVRLAQNSGGNLNVTANTYTLVRLLKTKVGGGNP